MLGILNHFLTLPQSCKFAEHVLTRGSYLKAMPSFVLSSFTWYLIDMPTKLALIVEMSDLDTTWDLLFVSEQIEKFSASRGRGCPNLASNLVCRFGEQQQYGWHGKTTKACGKNILQYFWVSPTLVGETKSQLTLWYWYENLKKNGNRFLLESIKRRLFSSFPRNI